MTTADVDRLYKIIDDLRDEVHGYRRDLNGRLRTLEEAEARRDGADEQRSNVVRLIFGVAGMAAAISAVVAFIFDQLR